MMEGERERAILLYDRDCRFCCWLLRRLLAWDRHDRIHPVALQEPEAARLLAHIDAQRRMDSWHLVEHGGKTWSAGRAIAPLLRLLPGGRPPAALAARFPRAADAGYALLARHRSALSAIVRAGRGR